MKRMKVGVRQDEGFFFVARKACKLEWRNGKREFLHGLSKFGGSRLAEILNYRHANFQFN